MKKLALVTIAIFVVMTALAVVMVSDGERVIVDQFTRLQQDGLHYYFTVRLGGKRQTLEVPGDVYAKHGYGDTLEAVWVQNVHH